MVLLSFKRNKFCFPYPRFPLGQHHWGSAADKVANRNSHVGKMFGNGPQSRQLKKPRATGTITDPFLLLCPSLQMISNGK